MSQITRCPSCGTTFKVVADQLRISEGWVRCGQCKEVFDAAAHLLVAETGHLLPEMSFEPTGSRWIAPAKNVQEPARVWGSARHSSSVAAASSKPLAGASTPSMPSTPLLGEAASPPATEVPVAPSVGPVQPLPAMPGNAVRSDDELRVPARSIPSFLSPPVPDEEGARVPDWGLEPTSPYGWRTRERVVMPQPLPDVTPGLPASSEREVLSNPVAHVSPTPAVPLGSHTPAPVAAAELSPQSLLQSGLDGYELPMPQLRDSEWPESEGVDEGDAGEVERPLPLLDPTLAQPRQAMEAGLGKGLLVAASVEPAAASEELDDPDERADRGLRKSKEHSLGATKLAREPHVAADDEELDDASPEPGFVRSARRRAFWSRPAMRVVMVLFAALLGLTLVAQMALRERDHWAARYPALQPLLAAMCAPWRCTTAAPRQIADVVIDSSSFVKSRADTYQLSVTLKSRADVPLAMPAMELTLTDAQDQPVLRKVLHPSDIAAPAALAPRGDWNGTLSISLAGGNRVAGYRLLAFYP